VQDIQAAPQGNFSRPTLNALYDSTLVSANGFRSHFASNFSSRNRAARAPRLDRRGGSHQRQYRAAGRPSAEELLFSFPMKALDVGLAKTSYDGFESCQPSSLGIWNDQPIPTDSINFQALDQYRSNDVCRQQRGLRKANSADPRSFHGHSLPAERSACPVEYVQLRRHPRRPRAITFPPAARCRFRPARRANRDDFVKVIRLTRTTNRSS